MKMLEVFVRKFKTTATHHIPAILEKWYVPRLNTQECSLFVIYFNKM